MAKEKKEKAAKSEVVKKQAAEPLRVEVHFPTITDLKQAIGFDADNNLVMGIQFKVRVDQFETFRLINLLKQPHAPLYATIGTTQSAMDFKFTKDGKVEIVKAQIAADKKPALDKPQEPKEAAVKIQEVSFNHVPEDPSPFGVFIEYVNGSGEIKSVGGRGNSPLEAVIAGVHNCGVAQDKNEPFEIRAALESLEPSDGAYKLIRVIDVGSFDIGEEKPKKGE